MSSTSVGVVRSPPVTASAPALCVLVSFDIAMLVLLLFTAVPSIGFGIPHTSTAYSTLGIATLLNSKRLSNCVGASNTKVLQYEVRVLK